MRLIINPECLGTCNILTWPRANNINILLGYIEYLEDVNNKRQ